MPTIHRTGPYRFYFYSHEPDEPPHVHVDRDACTLKAWLSPVSLAAGHGFRGREINVILEIVAVNRDRLLEAWHEFFSTGH